MWDRLADIERLARAFNGYFVTLKFTRLLAANNSEELCLRLNSAVRNQTIPVLGEMTSLSVDALGEHAWLSSCGVYCIIVPLPLVPYAEYQFTVVANTSFGVGENVSSFTFNTMTAGMIEVLLKVNVHCTLVQNRHCSIKFDLKF